MVMDRILKLLAEPPAEPKITDGYLDLLDAPPPPSLAQRVMQSSLLPRIYEDLWRPIGFNLAKGWPLGPTTAAEFALAREWLGPVETLLDVACGPGNVTRGLRDCVDPGGLAVGIDMSPTMLARAVRDTREGDIGYVRGNAIELPFREGTFDAVACFGAMYLFSDPWAALDDMTRVLKPGGRIVILTSLRPPVPAADSLGRLVGFRTFGAGEMVEALEKRGFVNVQRRGYPLMQMLGARLS